MTAVAGVLVLAAVVVAGVYWGRLRVVVELIRTDSVVRDGLAEIDFARWESENGWAAK